MQQRHLRDGKKRAFRDRIIDLATVVAHDLGCRAIAILRANEAPPTRDGRFGSFRTNGEECLLHRRRQHHRIDRRCGCFFGRVCDCSLRPLHDTLVQRGGSVRRAALSCAFAPFRTFFKRGASWLSMTKNALCLTPWLSSQRPVGLWHQHP